MLGNIEKIGAALSEGGVEGLLVTSPVNRLYATGFASTAGVLLVAGSEARFLTDSRYHEAAAAAIGGARVLLVDRENTYAAQIARLMGEWGVTRLGFEEESVTYAEYDRWRARLPGVELAPAQQLLMALRAVKSRRELDGIRAAQRIAETAFTEILPLISQGVTERRLAAELRCRMLQNGADDDAFDPIVVSGVRSSLPHGAPTDAVIGPGFLTIDFGARLGGWCSDTTRTICVGPPDAEMARVYETVLRAQLSGIAAVRAGVSGREVDAAARRVIEDAGYGAYFGHGFGHGLGLEVHEAPTAAPSGEAPLREGAVISAEPGIYLPGRFGVRIEDVVYVTKDGCENITNLPKELLIV